MCADRYLVSKRLLNRCFHSRFVAGVASTGNVYGSERRHQGFLRAIRDGFREFTHIAIQVDALHSRTNSFDAMIPSCSLNKVRAVSQSTFSKRISSRGRSCPMLGRSAEITLAIFGYPP